jgi:hypothetical protein
LNFAHAAAEGQHVSPGKQRHADEEVDDEAADLAGIAESKSEQITADHRILMILHECKVRHPVRGRQSRVLACRISFPFVFFSLFLFFFYKLISCRFLRFGPSDKFTMQNQFNFQAESSSA